MWIRLCALLIGVVVTGSAIADTVRDAFVMQSRLCVAVKAANAPEKCSDSEQRTLRLERSIATSEDGAVSVSYSAMEPLPPGMSLPLVAKQASGAFTLVTDAEPANPSEQLSKFLEADLASINVTTQAIRDCSAMPAAPCIAILTLTKIDAFEWFVTPVPGVDREFRIVAKLLVDPTLPAYSGRLLITDNGIDLAVTQTRQTERTVSISDGYSAVTVEAATDTIKFKRARDAS